METELGSFLKELSELTKKYKVEIAGCGCCGSPFLMNVDTGKGYDSIEKHPSDSKLECDYKQERYIW